MALWDKPWEASQVVSNSFNFTLDMHAVTNLASQFRSVINPVKHLRGKKAYWKIVNKLKSVTIVVIKKLYLPYFFQ